jgi:hypothetical protein
VLLPGLRLRESRTFRGFHAGDYLRVELRCAGQAGLGLIRRHLVKALSASRDRRSGLDKDAVARDGKSDGQGIRRRPAVDPRTGRRGAPGDSAFTSRCLGRLERTGPSQFMTAQARDGRARGSRSNRIDNLGRFGPLAPKYRNKPFDTYSGSATASRPGDVEGMVD